MPMQVVVPSVSRANRPQGTTFALAVELTSFTAPSGPALRGPAGGHRRPMVQELPAVLRSLAAA
jgi:hypothetical protein